jgi:hypothetical protein
LSSKRSERTYWKYCTNSGGKPLQSVSNDVFIFFSLIFSYFCFLVAACRGGERGGGGGVHGRRVVVGW